VEKKTEKFCITMGVAYNADGSEKLPLVFISKSKQPHCFKGKAPTSWDFQYFNKIAWMTMEFFKKYSIYELSEVSIV